MAQVAEAARDERESTARIDPFELAHAQRVFTEAIDAHVQSWYRNPYPKDRGNVVLLAPRMALQLAGLTWVLSGT